MANVHGKRTVITVDGDDLSQFTNTSNFERTSDEHDSTTYGKNDYCYEGGLLGGMFTMGGIYDNSATGPRASLEPLLGTKVTVVRKPDGTGTGKAQDSFSGLLTKYVETSPVADLVAWTAEFRVSDAVDSTPQS